MPEQPGGFRRHASIVRTEEPTPRIHPRPKLVEDGRSVVLLLADRETVFVLDRELRLRTPPGAFARFGDGCDELRRAPPRQHLLGGLEVPVKLPMPGRVRVRRVEDGVVEERVPGAQAQKLLTAPAGRDRIGKRMTWLPLVTQRASRAETILGTGSGRWTALV